MVREIIRGPINHRDASSNSEHIWRQPPTPISVPAADERAQPRFRPHDNPYRHTNTLGSKYHPPGNPNVHRTVLSMPRDGYNHVVAPSGLKRRKLDTGVSSAVTSNDASTSYARGPTPRSNVSEPDIQVIERPRSANSRSSRNFVLNNAGIIDPRAGFGDVARFVKSASPDPVNLPPLRRAVHAFETHPTEYSAFVSNERKGHAQESSGLTVEGSEEEDEIEEFTPTPPYSNSNTRKSPGIPINTVKKLTKYYDSGLALTPGLVRHPIQKGVKSVDLTTGSIIRSMRKKDEGTPSNQRSTIVYDHIGTSSSNFQNSTREKTQILPLEAWCCGLHLFEHSESAPLKLVHEAARRQIKVIWGPSLPEHFNFELDRGICSVMIENDQSERLGENVVVIFTTTEGEKWEEAERRFKGFKGGGSRSREVLAFLFSTAEDRGFSITSYQTFVAGIRKAFPTSAVELIGPSKGRGIWEYVTRHAAMFAQRESSKAEADRGESVVDELSVLVRSDTPGSSTAFMTRTSCHESKPSNGDTGPSTTHRRSARQSATRPSKIPPPPPPPDQSEPDEVVLMYPPTGPGALSIMQSDLRRLQPEEYINDTLIEFGLKLWLNDLRGKDPALADQIHVFSSFFYKKLNNKKNSGDGYKSVRKWTSKVDLFAKKYVIVPINENVHWYLAIIYEPGHTLEPPLALSRLANARLTRKRKQKQERIEASVETVVISELPLTEVLLDRSSPPPHVFKWDLEADTPSVDAGRATTPSTIEESHDVTITLSEQASATSSEAPIRDSSSYLMYPPSDGMDVDADISITSAAQNLTHQIAKTPLTSKQSSGIPVDQFYACLPKPGGANPVIVVDNEDSSEDQEQEAEVNDMLTVTQPPSEDLPPQTYIFTLDSLGARHPQAIRVLRQYLISEAKDKRSFDEVRDAVGKQVQVPVQPNTWDCGIYLLHFVKVFMNAPSELLEQILSTRGTMPGSERKKIWRDHEIPRFRDNLKSRIMQLSEEWKTEKTVREEEASKRVSGDVLEVEALSSEGEVDIVENAPSAKATSNPGHAKRLRG